MNSVTSTDLSYFCPHPFGKPDSQKNRGPIDQPDLRPRVTRAPKNGLACVPTALKMMTDQYYRAPNTKDLPERRIEKAASTRRKTQCEVDWKYQAMQAIDEQQAQLLRNTTKLSLANPATRSFMQRQGLSHDLSGNTIYLGDELAGFERQNEASNLYDYLILSALKAKEQPNLDFLTSIGTNVAEAYNDLMSIDPSLLETLASTNHCPDYKEIPSIHRSVLLEALVHREYAKRMHIRPSDWKPHAPFAKLVSELKEHGPLFICGEFGPAYYNVQPTVQRVVESRNIFGWKARDRKTDMGMNGHACVIVGAEKWEDGSEMVYFIDPNDESDPQKPGKERIYTMSYKRLTNLDSLATTLGIAFPEKVTKWPYAYRREMPMKPSESKE